jgi:hypothetical protein
VHEPAPDRFLGGVARPPCAGEVPAESREVLLVLGAQHAQHRRRRDDREEPSALVDDRHRAAVLGARLRHGLLLGVRRDDRCATIRKLRQARARRRGEDPLERDDSDERPLVVEQHDHAGECERRPAQAGASGGGRVAGSRRGHAVGRVRKRRVTPLRLPLGSGRPHGR